MTKSNPASSSREITLTLTDEAWAGVQSVANTLGISVSELLERVARGQLVVVDPEELEDSLDLQDALEALAEAEATGEEPIPWEKVQAELGLG